MFFVDLRVLLQWPIGDDKGGVSLETMNHVSSIDHILLAHRRRHANFFFFETYGDVSAVGYFYS